MWPQVDFTRLARVNWAIQISPRLGHTNLATDGPYETGPDWTLQSWPHLDHAKLATV